MLTYKYMKNIIISTIKYGIVMGAGFFSFAQISLAAPVLTPATVSGVSRTSAILVAKVSNAGAHNVSVWFEWGETSSLEKTPAGMRDIYGEGYFQGNLSGLKEGNTYYYRAVAMMDGAQVTSATGTFTTDGGAAAVAKTSAEDTTTAVKNDTQTTVSPQTKKTTSAPAEEKAATATDKDAVVATINTKSVSVTDTNIASVLGAGNGVLPGTLIGWLVLFIAILTVVILAHMIYTQNIERKKALEQAKMKMTPAVA